MATIDELVKQYQTDPALQAEVKEIIADRKVSMKEFLTFCKKHNVSVSLDQINGYMEQAKQLGFIK